MSALTELDRGILDVEARAWRRAGAKESHVAATLGLTATRYYQRLNVLIEREEALAYSPVVVHRLRRRLDAEARHRRSTSAA